MSMPDRPSLGISLRILSGLLAAGMFICVKAAGPDVPLGEVVFFRSFFAIIPLVLFLWMRGEFPQGMATKRPFQHLLRSGFGAIALFTSFAALSYLTLAEALLIAQLSPMLMALFAVIILSEQLTVWRIAGIQVAAKARMRCNHTNAWFGHFPELSQVTEAREWHGSTRLKQGE